MRSSEWLSWSLNYYFFLYRHFLHQKTYIDKKFDFFCNLTILDNDLFFYGAYMIDISGDSNNILQNVDDVWIKEQIAKNPLLLEKWEEVVPAYFTSKGFCYSLNETRKQLVQNKKISKENIFINAINEKFGLYNVQDKIIKNKIYSLVGNFLNILKSSKEKIEATSKSTRNSLHKDLSYSEEYGEILMIMDDLIFEFFTSKELGASISEGEKNSFGEQALDIFLKKHAEDIAKGKIDIKKLHAYLYNQKIMQ